MSHGVFNVWHTHTMSGLIRGWDLMIRLWACIRYNVGKNASSDNRLYWELCVECLRASGTGKMEGVERRSSEPIEGAFTLWSPSTIALQCDRGWWDGIHHQTALGIMKFCLRKTAIKLSDTMCMTYHTMSDLMRGWDLMIRLWGLWACIRYFGRNRVTKLK